jgi:hypothetical protein
MKNTLTKHQLAVLEAADRQQDEGDKYDDRFAPCLSYRAGEVGARFAYRPNAVTEQLLLRDGMIERRPRNESVMEQCRARVEEIVAEARREIAHNWREAHDLLHTAVLMEKKMAIVTYVITDLGRLAVKGARTKQ